MGNESQLLTLESFSNYRARDVSPARHSITPLSSLCWAYLIYRMTKPTKPTMSASLEAKFAAQHAAAALFSTTITTSRRGSARRNEHERTYTEYAIQSVQYSGTLQVYHETTRTSP